MLTNVAVAVALAASIALGPPPTEVRTVVDHVHGVRIADDYRWLESLESQDESVRQWTSLQNDHTREMLDHAGFGVVKGLHFQQRRRATRFVGRLRLPQHQSFSAL